MRLAARNPGMTRVERAERLRRERAAALALRVAYPEVQQLRLELQFEGVGNNTPAAQSHVLHPPARAFFAFPCPYADCDGQFDLNGAVNAALADASHRAEGVLVCSGARARDHLSKQPCQLNLVYKVAALYQVES